MLLRDDHVGDAIGAVFLDASPDNPDAIIERLHDYLGQRVRVTRFELMAERLEVEIEVSALTDEANRLAATAADLSFKGGRRSAVALFRQALALDPLNPEALLGLGLLLTDLSYHREALVLLKLARESGRETVDLLHALGRACMQADRKASAISYLEKGFELDPSHFGVRRALAELGRRPKIPQRSQNHESPPAVATRPSLKNS